MAEDEDDVRLAQRDVAIDVAVAVERLAVVLKELYVNALAALTAAVAVRGSALELPQVGPVPRDLQHEWNKVSRMSESMHKRENRHDAQGARDARDPKARRPRALARS